jgi:hypothetical protein
LSSHPHRAHRCGRAWLTSRSGPQPVRAHFDLWAPSKETAYSNNRRAAIENIVDADPVAAYVRDIMADRAQWIGSASDLLQAGTNRSGWPKSARALAGRLRRAQTFLRTLGIEIAFGRQGRLATRRIKITAIVEKRSHSTMSTVSTVSRVSDNEYGTGLKPPPPGGASQYLLASPDAAVSTTVVLHPKLPPLFNRYFRIEAVLERYSSCSSERLLSACKNKHPKHHDRIERLPAGATLLHFPGVSTTALLRRETSPMAPVDRLLRADRPAQTVPPTGCQHQRTPIAPSSPPRIMPARMRFAQVSGGRYLSRCPTRKARCENFPLFPIWEHCYKA